MKSYAAGIVAAALSWAPLPANTDIPPTAPLGALVLTSASGFHGALAEARAAEGLPALVAHPQLIRAAEAHARDMRRNSFFSHTGLNGSRVRDRVGAQGYDGCFWAENIAFGDIDEAEVFRRWMSSPGHRRNLLHARAAHYGLARAGSGQQTFWVLAFGAPC